MYWDDDDDNCGYDRDMFMMSEAYRDMTPDWVFPELNYLKEEDEEYWNSSSDDDKKEEEEPKTRKKNVPNKRKPVTTYGTYVIRDPETFAGLTYDKLIKEEKDKINEIKEARAYAKEHPILFALKKRFIGYPCLGSHYNYLHKFL
jgi:hypothetical protein|nr:MAG TPA: hypothetical protein [Caudoviricetes sp.]DAX90132.1 MAG TPA: hypothetical protein [Caudoviricetes sp.]